MLFRKKKKTEPPRITIEHPTPLQMNIIAWCMVEEIEQRIKKKKDEDEKKRKEAERLRNMQDKGRDRKSTRLNSSHSAKSRMPSSA